MILLKLISKLPFWLLYILSDIFAFIVEFIIKYRKKVILKNLQKSFPDKTFKELKKIKSRYYRNLTDVTLETFKLISMSKEAVIKRVKFVNIERYNELYDNNTSVILTASHLCNWEWMLAITAIQIKLKTDVAYQRIKNPFFDRLMCTIRSKFGSIPVEKNHIFRESLKKRKTPHIIALAADQSPPLHSEHIIWTRFLHQNTAFYSGMAWLAKSFSWPIIYYDMRRIKRGFYEIEIKDVCLSPENMDDEKILESYVKLVEDSIKRSPHCWLWSHNRWKRENNNL